MKKLGSTFLAGLLTCAFGTSQPARADPIQVNARLVRENGSPIQGMKTRVVIGSEKAARSPGSGKSSVTGADGLVSCRVEAPVKQRSIKLDSVFFRHPSQLIEVGIEMELLGQPALYWIEIDLVKAGPLAGMRVFLPGKNGQFDVPLTHHPKTQSWSLPGATNGMQLSGIGARLLEHDMKRGPDGAWTIDLRIEKQEFRVR